MAFIESRKKQSGEEIIVSPVPVTSQMVTASSQVNGNFSGDMAFNGASCNLSTLQGGWLASNSDNTPTLTVNFGRSYTLGKIVIETANNNSPDTDRDVYIEGSNDGSTWVNILATGSTTSLSFIVGEYAQYTINLNEGNYQYFRLRGTQPFFGGSYQYACCFSEILLYDRASQSGGEVFNPVFTERTIATNNNQLSFTFTEDYHNFDFVKVTTHNVSSSIDTDFITTPSIIDACLSLGSVNFNEYGNNQYVAYTESGLTWTQYDSRNLYVSEVKGMTCENATVSETVIYQAQARSSTSVTVTYSQGSLFDFDLILFSANSSANGEVLPCYYQFSSGIRLTDKVGMAFNAYNSYSAISVSEHELSANRYACVVGIKFETN